MKRIICILAMLCPYVCGLAQPIPAQEKGIGIGDIMPDVMLVNIYNHPLKQGKFSALQKELTIIDFWASWCGACLGSFDKMHQLQQDFNKQLQVLMVNAYQPDDAGKIAALLKKRKQQHGKDFSLSYLLQDSLLNALFPHSMIPHYVWINKERKVIAITESSGVTAANIEAVLKGEPVAFAQKQDPMPEEAMSATADDEGLLYSTRLSGENKGLAAGISFTPAGRDSISSMRISNYSLLRLYQLANMDLFGKRVGWLVIDSNIAGLFAKVNNRPARYIFEWKGAPLGKKQAYQLLNNTLQQYFKVEAVASDSNMACYTLTAAKEPVLKNANATVSSTQKSADQFTNINALAAHLQEILQRPVLNETGVNHSISLSLPADFAAYNFNQVQAYLLQQGLLLNKANRLLKVQWYRAINKPLQSPLN